MAGDHGFADWFEQAMRWHEGTPDTFERARTELAYGERDDARAAAWTHARICARRSRHSDELGAEPWAERARLEPGDRRAARKRDPSTLNQLTPRELQIALDLASDDHPRGCGQLYLSPRRSNTTCAASTASSCIASRSELAEAVRPADPG